MLDLYFTGILFLHEYPEERKSVSSYSDRKVISDYAVLSLFHCEKPYLQSFVVVSSLKYFHSFRCVVECFIDKKEEQEEEEENFCSINSREKNNNNMTRLMLNF